MMKIEKTTIADRPSSAANRYMTMVQEDSLERSLLKYRCCDDPMDGMAGPYRLCEDEVKRVVGDWKNGWYRLGRLRNGGVPQVNYVGRSDSNLGGRILAKREYEYEWFWVRKTRSEKEAFEGECRDWHKFTEEYGVVLDNKIHPDKPDDKLCPCPVEGCDEKRGRTVKK